MAEVGKREDCEADTRVRFVATMIVSTLMVAVSVYVMSYAVLAPERVGARGTGSAAAIHEHS